MFVFQPYSVDELIAMTATRTGDVKIGQQLHEEENAEYIILGIEESVGPQANQGKSGAEYAFRAFLTKFLNMQANDFLKNKKIAVIGSIKSEVAVPELNKYLAVESLDEIVTAILTKYWKLGKKVIVVGGGHNNAYPIIKAIAKKIERPLSVVNLDAHADYRLKEGRHSGNGFRYASEEGFLNQYFALGLHVPYNAAYMLADMKKAGHQFTFFEEYIGGERDWGKDFEQLAEKFENSGSAIGIELDLDAIANMPSSACSPSGVSLETARRYIRTLTKLNNWHYLHLTEGAPTDKKEDETVGKALAYLTFDAVSHKKINIQEG